MRDLSDLRMTEPWQCALHRVAAAHARSFHAGRPVCDGVSGRLRYELRLTWLGGMRILDRLERDDFNVFVARPDARRRRCVAARGAECSRGNRHEPARHQLLLLVPRPARGKARGDRGGLGFLPGRGRCRGRERDDDGEAGARARAVARRARPALRRTRAGHARRPRPASCSSSGSTCRGPRSKISSTAWRWIWSAAGTKRSRR